MEDPVLDEDEDVDIEYQTPSSELDVVNTTDSQSDGVNAQQDQYDVLHRTFRDYFINEITETFADELDALRRKEAFFGPDKLQILSDCLSQGVNLFSQVEKELSIVQKLNTTPQETKSEISKPSTPSASEKTSQPKAQTPNSSISKSNTNNTSQKDAMDIEPTPEEVKTEKKSKKEKKNKNHKRDSTSNGTNT